MMEPLAQIERVMFLRRVELFSHCTAAQILRLAAIAEERRFEAGETIYEVHDPAGSLHCVVDGTVKLDNPPHQVVVETGGAFGVSELLAGRLRHATATAETDTLTLAIEAHDFLDLLSNNIEIVRALFRSLYEKISAPLAW